MLPALTAYDQRHRSVERHRDCSTGEHERQYSMMEEQARLSMSRYSHDIYASTDDNDSSANTFRISRWVSRRWIFYFVLGTAYLSRVLTTGHLTLFRFLLLTVIYGAWLVIFSLGRRLGEHFRCGGLCTGLLACASQFSPCQARTSLGSRS